MGIKEKLAVRRRRLRLTRSRPSAVSQDELELHMPEPQPVCRLQISSTIFGSANGQPDKKIVVNKIEKVASMDCQLPRQPFPEELHMPLLFNDEPLRRFEEQREPETVCRAPEACQDGSRDAQQLFGVYVNPLAFVRSQQQ